MSEFTHTLKNIFQSADKAASTLTNKVDGLATYADPQDINAALRLATKEQAIKGATERLGMDAKLHSFDLKQLGATQDKNMLERKKILNEITSSRSSLKHDVEKYNIDQLKDALKSNEISFNQKQQLEKIIVEREKLQLSHLGRDLKDNSLKLEHDKNLFGQEKTFFQDEKARHQDTIKRDKDELSRGKNDLTLREMKLMQKEDEVNKKNSLFGSNTLTAVLAGAGTLKALDYGTKKYKEHEVSTELQDNVAFARQSKPELKKVDLSVLNEWIESIYSLAPSMAKDKGLSATALQTVQRYGGNIDLATAKILSEIGDKSKKAKDDKWSSDLGNYALASNILGA